MLFPDRSYQTSCESGVTCRIHCPIVPCAIAWKGESRYRQFLCIYTRRAVNVTAIQREKEKEKDYLTLEQAQKLLEAARQGRLECLLTVALVNGMRLGELLALRWSEVDMTRGILQVRHTVNRIKGFGITESEPKTESSKRSIVLPPFVIDTLVQLYFARAKL